MLPSALIAASALVYDAAGNHFRPIAAEAASAIISACEGEPVCAATLVVMCQLESRCQLHAVGDGGRAQGPFQEWTGGLARTSSWEASARHYVATLGRAIRVCPDYPISILGGYRCRSTVLQTWRWKQVRAVAWELAK